MDKKNRRDYTILLILHIILIILLLLLINLSINQKKLIISFITSIVLLFNTVNTVWLISILSKN